MYGEMTGILNMRARCFPNANLPPIGDDRCNPPAVTASSGSGDKSGELYAQVMGWDDKGFGTMSPRTEADLAAMIRLCKASFPSQSRVLEIGFGNGGVLFYGRRRQWEMHGTELNELLLKRARGNGFDVRHGDNLSSFTEPFDLVLAFDVLEHMPGDKLPELFERVRRMVKDGGIFIARFPNGDSPFSRFVQHGDATHVTVLGSRKAAYYARHAGMEIVYLGGQPQPLLAGLPHFCYRIVANPIRSLLNLFLNLLFCPGDPRSLCTTNLVMVLRAAKASAPELNGHPQG